MAVVDGASCKAVTSVSTPASVTSIGNEAFGSCEKLQEANLSACKKLATIAYGAFSRCKALTSVSFPASLTSIGQNAFYECKALTSVSLPASVTAIGQEAFYQCNALASVTMKCKYSSGFKSGIFNGCYALGSGSIKVPADQVDTYKSHASHLGVQNDRFAPLQP